MRECGVQTEQGWGEVMMLAEQGKTEEQSQMAAAAGQP